MNTVQNNSLMQRAQFQLKMLIPFTSVTLKLNLGGHHRPPGEAAPLFILTIDL